MPTDIPTAKVLNLKSQNLTNNQIIQSLQREGYTVNQVYDAMNQAELKANVEAYPMEPGQFQNQFQEPMQQTQSNTNNAQPPQYSQDTLQALVEAVIEEKWEELVKGMQRVIDWKDKTEQRLTSVEQDIKDVKESFSKLHAALVEKVGEYDQHVMGVSTELQALEKVFQKILPGFVESVGELARVTRDMKDLHAEMRNKKE